MSVVVVVPVGTQARVSVLDFEWTSLTPGLAPLELTARLREQAREAGFDLAAVLVAPQFPTDIRHNSKIDRSRLAVWADSVLAGRSEEHTSELQSRFDLVCRLLLEK